VVRSNPLNSQAPWSCSCCGKDTTHEMETMLVTAFMHTTLDVLEGLGKHMYWPPMPYCENCGDTYGKSSSSSSCACRSGSIGRDRWYPLGWPGGKDQALTRLLVPFTLLSFLADELHTLVTYTFSHELGRWVLQQVVKGDWMSHEAVWMSHAVLKVREALQCWIDNGGKLEPEEMWGGEWLRVPLLVANGLLMAVPVDFACNNPDCESLDGPWELGLVTHRAKVVCGGCGVARYCSRNCQQQHWKWHMDTCRRLHGCVKGT
jgi:hypothetical protein